MKKLFALVIALVLALSATAALAQEYTVYLITMDLEDMHWVSVDEGAQAAVAEAKEAGVELRYVGMARPPARTMLLRSKLSTTLMLTTQTSSCWPPTAPTPRLPPSSSTMQTA